MCVSDMCLYVYMREREGRKRERERERERESWKGISFPIKAPLLIITLCDLLLLGVIVMMGEAVVRKESMPCSGGCGTRGPLS